MIRRASPLLALAFASALAGCGGGTAPTVHDAEAERANAMADVTGWHRMFDGVPESLAAARQFGYRTGDYAAAADGTGFRAESEPVALTTMGGPESTSRFVTTGPTDAQFATIAFTLDIPEGPVDGELASAAKTRFTAVLRDYLSQFAIAAGDGFAPVAAEQDADTAIGDVPTQIQVTPLQGESRRITVTFTRPEAISPDHSQPQG